MNRNIIVSWIGLDFPFHAHVLFFFSGPETRGSLCSFNGGGWAQLKAESCRSLRLTYCGKWELAHFQAS